MWQIKKPWTTRSAYTTTSGSIDIRVRYIRMIWMPSSVPGSAPTNHTQVHLKDLGYSSSELEYSLLLIWMQQYQIVEVNCY